MDDVGSDDHVFNKLQRLSILLLGVIFFALSGSIISEDGKRNSLDGYILGSFTDTIRPTGNARKCTRKR